jgi:hypothetical protein
MPRRRMRIGLRAPGVESLKITPEKTSEFSPKTI